MERDEVGDITGLNINKNKNNSFAQSRFDAHVDIIAFVVVERMLHFCLCV